MLVYMSNESWGRTTSVNRGWHPTVKCTRVKGIGNPAVLVAEHNTRLARRLTLED